MAAGILLTAATYAVLRPTPLEEILLAPLALPCMIDVALQRYFKLPSTNGRRAVTGLLLGSSTLGWSAALFVGMSQWS